jgi:hypothetical protein
MNGNYKYPASTFEANPTVNSLFVFPDGNCFIKKSDADTYAKTSKRECIVMEREGEPKEENEETQTETTNKKPSKKK